MHITKDGQFQATTLTETGNPFWEGNGTFRGLLLLSLALKVPQHRALCCTYSRKWVQYIIFLKTVSEKPEKLLCQKKNNVYSFLCLCLGIDNVLLKYNFLLALHRIPVEVANFPCCNLFFLVQLEWESSNPSLRPQMWPTASLCSPTSSDPLD